MLYHIQYTDWDHVEEESSMANSKGIIEMIGGMLVVKRYMN